MAADEAISTARLRRRELHLAMVGLETTLAEPAAAAGWAKALIRDAEALHAAVARHNAATEAPGGILSEMLDEAPRLDNRLAALQAEHAGMLAAAAALVDAARAPKGEGTDTVRVQALELLGMLARHRQRGADLVYDALDVDIGGQA